MSTELIAAQPHGCPGCKPEMLTADRIDERHTALRFGDNGRGVTAVTINGGEDVSRFVNEARSGPDGFVVAMHCSDEGYVLHACPNCRREPCTVRVNGDVRVEGSIVHNEMALREGV